MISSLQQHKDSPVLKLQDLTTSISVDLEELLLKGKMIANKLELDESSKWFELELNSYKNESDNNIPDYRKIPNVPIKGLPLGNKEWLPVAISTLFDVCTPEYEEFTTVHFKNSVSMLQQFAKKDDNILYFDVPDYMSYELNHRLGLRSSRMSWAISPTVFSMMLTNIRSRILDWALSLEKKEIYGEGLLFSPEEKKEAQNVTYNNTINNNGNGMTVLGNVDSTNSVVGGTVSNVQQQNITGDFSALERQLKEHGLDDADINELKDIVDQTSKPQSEEEVRKVYGGWLGKMIGKAYSGTIKLTAAAAPAVLTNAICHYFGIPV